MSLSAKTYNQTWFIEQMKELVQLERKDTENQRQRLPDRLLVQAKKTVLPTATSPRSWDPGRRDPENGAPAWALSSAGTPFPSPVSKTQPITTPHLQRPRQGHDVGQPQSDGAWRRPEPDRQGIEFDYCWRPRRTSRCAMRGSSPSW